MVLWLAVRLHFLKAFFKIIGGHVAKTVDRIAEKGQKVVPRIFSDGSEPMMP